MNKYMEDIAKLLVIEGKMKELSEAASILRKSICDDLPDEGVEHCGKKINRVTKKTFSLKEGVLPEDVMKNFPECVKVETSLDMKSLVKIPNAHCLLDMSSSSYITVKALKEGGSDGNN